MRLKTLQELEEEFAAKKRELLEKQRVLHEHVPPHLQEQVYLLLFASKPRPWVIFQSDTLNNAVEIIQAFGEPLTVTCRKDGAVSVCPEDEHGTRYLQKPVEWSVPRCVKLRQHGGRGFYVVELVAYTQPIRVSVKIANLPWHFRASLSAHHNSDGVPTHAVFNENTGILKELKSQRVKFASGSIDAFHLRYYFEGPEKLLNLV